MAIPALNSNLTVRAIAIKSTATSIILRLLVGLLVSVAAFALGYALQILRGGNLSGAIIAIYLLSLFTLLETVAEFCLELFSPSIISYNQDGFFLIRDKPFHSYTTHSLSSDTRIMLGRWLGCPTIAGIYYKDTISSSVFIRNKNALYLAEEASRLHGVNIQTIHAPMLLDVLPFAVFRRL